MKITIAAIILTAIMAIKSLFVIPRMLPNNAASKLRVKVLNRLINATPRAKLAVVTIPIAASALIRLFLAARFISIAETKPHTLAPMNRFIERT